MRDNFFGAAGWDNLSKVLINEGDTVLDPFMGSGSTGVAAKKNNMNFIGIEINDNYFQIATRRLQEMK